MSDSPVSHHDAGASEKEPAQATDEQSAQMEQAYAQMRRKLRMTKLSENIKHKIMILSGKGGVGKSTVATGLALSLAQQGNKVGLLDIDITGPNIPKMMGLGGHELHVEDGLIHPSVGQLGVKVISMAFLLEDEDTPVVWRGPIKLGAIQQFIADVEWGVLDHMILDFPPGTSDEPLTVAQSLPDIDGIVIVTTPQDVALLDSRKSISFAKTLNIPVLGVVENMSGFTVRGKVKPNSKVELDGPGGSNVEATVDEEGNWSATLDIFKEGGGRKTAEELGVPFLGALPFDPGVVRGGDDGVHRIIAEPEGESAIAFAHVVKALSEQLSDNDGPGINII